MTDQLSVQLYTVREALDADMAGALRRLVDIGFTRVEPYGIADRPELVQGLAEAGLAAPTAHAHLIGGATPELFRLARALGVAALIEPFTPVARWQTREDIALLAAELNEVAKAAADHGLRVGYHNHEHELESVIEGVTALEVFADHLDDAVVLEVDTYWVTAGGQDPVALLHRLGEKVTALHIKDGPATKDPADQVAVGAGSMPVLEIIRAAPDALRVIELDDSRGDRFAAVSDSHAWLTAHAGTAV
ncbi:MAG: sugar phosphate isomerase/epimerase family protein [Janthinobacterium lividum]